MFEDDKELLCPECGEPTQFVANVKAWVEVPYTAEWDDINMCWDEELDFDYPEQVYEDNYELDSIMCEDCNATFSEDRLMAYNEPDDGEFTDD